MILAGYIYCFSMCDAKHFVFTSDRRRIRLAVCQTHPINVKSATSRVHSLGCFILCVVKSRVAVHLNANAMVLLARRSYLLLQVRNLLT